MNKHLLPLQVKTGPALDNSLCLEEFNSSHCTDGSTYLPLKATDTINKVLLLHQQADELVVCENVRQGRCHTRKRNDISAAKFYKSRTSEFFAVTNDPFTKNVAFIAPGLHDGFQTLYVASPYNGSPPRLSLPTLAGRSLQERNKFAFSFSDGLTGGTKLKFKHDLLDSYRVDYITGFSFQGYSYFLINAPSPSTPTRLGQVCQKDDTFSSYVEIPLTCSSEKGTFSRITAASLVTPPTDAAASSIGVFLLVAFNDAEGTSSGMCYFMFSKIKEVITSNWNNCFNGDQKDLSYQFSNRPCRKLVSVNHKQWICSSNWLISFTKMKINLRLKAF